jgi:hypothetical protein
LENETKSKFLNKYKYIRNKMSNIFKNNNLKSTSTEDQCVEYPSIMEKNINQSNTHGWDYFKNGDPYTCEELFHHLHEFEYCNSSLEDSLYGQTPGKICSACLPDNTKKLVYNC